MNTNSSRTFSVKSAILFSLGAGLLAVVLTIALQTSGIQLPTIAQLLAGTPLSTTNTVAGEGVSFEIPGKPARLIIPAIGVDAHVQSVGLSWKGTGDMGIPTNFTDVAWYKGGPLPGMPGSAVIDGHLDGRDVPKAVFYDLDKLKRGDVVKVVDEKGRVFEFKVVRTEIYAQDADATEVFTGTGSTARLNLITCTGNWDAAQKLYDKRVVVFTELVT